VALTNSDKAVFTASLVCDPLTNIAVFGFSLSLASLFLSTLLERAFLGLLWVSHIYVEHGDSVSCKTEGQKEG